MTTWISPTGFVDSGGTWSDEAKAYDTDTDTFAFSGLVRGSWGGILEVTHAGVYCDKVKYWANLSSGDTFLIDLDVYYNGAWVDLYSGTLAALQWVEVELGGIYELTSARVSMKYSNGNIIAEQRLHEFYFGAIDTKVARIAFGSNAFATTPSWTDVSSDMMQLYTKRGRQNEMGRIESGVAMVKLLNTSGEYWPNNTSSSLYPNVTPVKRINLRATYAGVTYDLYTGYVETWKPGFVLQPITAPVMTVTCADLHKNIARYNLNNAGYAEELTGTRIDNVLTDLGYSTTDRSLDTGQISVITTGALANVNALNHLYTIQQTEVGLLFMAGTGYATYHDRVHRSTATSAATFGDGAGENKIYAYNYSLEDFYIKNDIRITRDGGTEQVATDSDSQLAYGNRTLSYTNLPCLTDDDAQDIAYFYLRNYKETAMRLNSITIKPAADPSNLYSKVYGYDISQRITVNLSKGSLSRDYFIEGIQHEWDAREPDIFITKWQLSDADIRGFPVRATETLRPDAAGDNTGLAPNPTTSANYMCVNTAPTDDTTNVYLTSVATTAYDLYNISAMSVTDSPLLKVVVYARMRGNVDPATANILLKTGGTIYGMSSTDVITTSSVFVDYNKEWITNPFSSTNWTLSDITDLQIGVSFPTPTTGNAALCSQNYAIVDYYSGW